MNANRIARRLIASIVATAALGGSLALGGTMTTAGEGKWYGRPAKTTTQHAGEGIWYSKVIKHGEGKWY